MLCWIREYAGISCSIACSLASIAERNAMATSETVIANRIGSDGRRERSVAGNLLHALLGAARRKPLGAAGFVVIITIVVAAVFAPIVAPYGYNETDIANRLQSPSR